MTYLFTSFIADMTKTIKKFEYYRELNWAKLPSKFATDKFDVR